MEFFKINRNIPFMSYGRYTTTISLVTFILAVFFIVTKGLNFGVDFTGGTVMEVHYSQTADLDKVRRQLTEMGLHDVLVQNFGSSHDVLLQVSLKQNVVGAKLSEQILDKLRQQDASVEMRRVEFVGPQVGKDLVENGALALLLVSIGIACYLWVRFEWKFGLAAIIANLHDVIIIIGFFAFFQWDFSLTVLAALLAVLGYSVNESVVVFDRIRENFRKMRKTEVAEIIDNAITRTMSRTIITHLCTQMMVTAMLFLGGETLHYFALALTIGILFSIYSSVLVASPLLMLMGVSREDFIKTDKVAEEVLP
ncbi:protein translocase subunit SecF [Candidatus Nitrotoga arctica]|uniref:Protein-export membrane protein SecF n=1 Tax=Candidatus Nitrotoga arctica TaxID=453162 RepID=A0ABM8YXS0_9PROT|nr:protein translocase subunit SecF [Candidatus Nitrotoga arctica]CAG9932300.1 Protein translocase subunit SecF [Candidatus Nitrotoga arctica]